MDEQPSRTPNGLAESAVLPRTAVLVLGAVAFAAAYGQAPLYYSNQNQYFLHGLAAAGVGQLHDDWLARTADPTPVFSGFVALTARFLHPAAFYLDHAALLAAYAAALVGLFASLAGPECAARPLAGVPRFARSCPRRSGPLAVLPPVWAGLSLVSACRPGWR